MLTNHINFSLNHVKAALFGLAVGDALGVPVEFKSRSELLKCPIKDMQGFGTWNQPVGTWSDDSSLAFCLAESLVSGYDLNDIAGKFISWREGGYWGAHHRVFDIGNATNAAILRLKSGVSPVLAGGFEESDNGNGSLMRILPIAFFLKGMDISQRYQVVKEVSSVTHAHFRSVFACFIYIEMALQLIKGLFPKEAYISMQVVVNDFVSELEFNRREVDLFNRMLQNDISLEGVDSIYSGGYVLQTLEASLWCLLTTESYTSAVLKAVNLGGDTDTTACVTGGLAGLHYGYNGLLSAWSRQIARFGDIDRLSNQLYKKYS
ncbi:MAG: ADP-ribosylglycohydrolase family protein [Chitinophagaceae bacterium]|nr:ADP-ribosylglycohydrolase family protein [Chitinophagaceae bacterium]MCW5927134.1 ADP-ribosylglycohydrolase family protein [Chitinophagaceae bacterium]